MAAVLTDRDCRWRLSRPADLPARLFEWIVSKYGHDPAKASLSEKRVADESPTGRNQRTVGLRLLPSPTTTLIQASVPERPIALPAERCSCAARCASSSAAQPEPIPLKATGPAIDALGCQQLGNASRISTTPS